MTTAFNAVSNSEVELTDDLESPASALLRSFDIDPNAPLLCESSPLSMRPDSMTPEARAERDRREGERAEVLAQLERERRDAAHKRRKGWGY